jgi:AdoMet-dependent rRNA methyltransferase SPB1
LDNEITERVQEHKEYQLDKDNESREEKMKHKKIAKGKRNLEMQVEHANQMEMKKYNNKDILDRDDEDSDSEASMSDDDLAQIKAIEDKNRKRVKVTEDEKFINPLVATKKDLKRFKKSLEEKDEKLPSDSDNFESDVEEIGKELDKKVQDVKDLKKKRDLKKKAKEEIDLGFKEAKAEKTYSDYDSDEIAEIRAIGKRMLRKKERSEIIDAATNRYAYSDDPKLLPTWFVTEEKKFNQPIKPVTKAEIQIEKKFMRDYNARPSQKLAEFKERKKRKMIKAMAKVRQKATVIANSEEIHDGSKMRQIKKLYSKEKKSIKERFNKQSESVVSRNFSASTPGKTQGRKFKMVDRRLKKDTRATKRIEKKTKGRKGKRAKITK